MDAFEVVGPGLLTTVQDLGRWGWQRYGVPVSGAMDPLALEIGNILVGNDRGAAGLEAALSGPTLRAVSPLVVAICGASCKATLDGTPVPGWEAVEIRPGQLLALGSISAGVWVYLCVSGGIDVPIVMGSRSTFLRGGFGGFEGRALKTGDILRCGSLPLALVAGRSLAQDLKPKAGQQVEVRAVPGPNEQVFTRESLTTFFSTPFTVTRESDRMGYRLDGPPLTVLGATDILSEGAVTGSVQVPSSGLPIVLMADRPPTGGYAKIATVISPDVRRIAQLAPGASMRFRPVTVEEAGQAVIDHEAMIQRFAASLRERS